MNAVELIRRKRDRGRYSAGELEWLMAEFAAGNIPDYQMAAWLMAVCLRGMTVEETVALTAAMMKSGEVLDLSALPGPKVDKHSTGGVGDKVSLVLAPMVAACDVLVPMISGRALGHTGGTLDKLAAIPGFRTDLGPTAFRRCLEMAGLAIVGQSERICPVDRRLYALRDVTATVESAPLIAASIMSKKLAEGIDGLVLDVKAGSGAFCAKVSQARRLGRLMMAIGARLGKPVRALVTAMWQPLGRSVGNAVEVIEAIDALKGNWADDLAEVSLALGEQMLVLSGRARSEVQARRQLLRALSSGRALERFRAMVRAQGGDPAVIDNPGVMIERGHRVEVCAASPGWVRSIDALRVGLIGVELGIGRLKVDATVDAAAGFVFHRKAGDRVAKGELLVEVLGSDRDRVAAAAAAVARAIVIGPVAPKPVGAVCARLSGNGGAGVRQRRNTGR